jgi:hypothetical protein
MSHASGVCSVGDLGHPQHGIKRIQNSEEPET